jgi:hypothetical protein
MKNVKRKSGPAQLKPEFIREAVSENCWNFLNEVLYKLCADNPCHTKDDIIMAKVMLIGRAYSATIERGRAAAGAGGRDFYETRVAPKIHKSDIDEWFRALGKSSVNRDVELNLVTHTRLMRLFKEISGKKKRSLASKYLHFHFPKHFYIYDSRAHNAILKLTRPIRKRHPGFRGYDTVYSRFYFRCEALNEQIAKLVGRHLSPRELDNLLLAYDRLISNG